MSKLYIAYGSNLSVDQMAKRCPEAVIAGKAVLTGWKLVFKTCATIEKARGRKVPVLIWSISEEDEKCLDRYEAFPAFYDKMDLKVSMTDLNGENPRKVSAMVYVMTDKFSISEPPSSYYQTLLEGYKRFGFDETILKTALKEAGGRKEE